MNNKDLRIDPKVFLRKAEHTICIISFDLEPRKPRTDGMKNAKLRRRTAGLNQTTSTQGQGRSSGSKWRIVLWTASMNESITSPLLFQGQFSDIVFLWPQRVTMLPLLWQCSVWKQWNWNLCLSWLSSVLDQLVKLKYCFEIKWRQTWPNSPSSFFFPSSP